GELGYEILDVADRTHGSERGKDALQPFAVHVGMAIDEPGNDGLASEVDGACRKRGERRHGGVRTDGQDAVAGNGDGLRDRKGPIDGDDLAVAEHEVGGPDDWHRSKTIRSKSGVSPRAANHVRFGTTLAHFRWGDDWPPIPPFRQPPLSLFGPRPSRGKIEKHDTPRL